MNQRQEDGNLLLYVIGYDPYHFGEYRRAVIAARSEHEAVALLLERVLRPLPEEHRQDATQRIMASLSVLRSMRIPADSGVLYSD